VIEVIRQKKTKTVKQTKKTKTTTWRQ